MAGFLSLVFRFMGDNSDFKSKVRETEHSVDGLAEKLEGAFKGLGVGFGIGEIARLGKEGIEQAAKFEDLSERLGMSTDAIQHLARAARLGGSDIESIAVNVDKLRNAMGVAYGTGEAAKSMQTNFEALGISLDELKSSDPSELFMKLIDMMAKGEIGIAQFHNGVEILGKGFSKLIPIAKEMEHAKKGLSFTDDEISKLKEAGNTWSNIWNAVKVGTGKTVGVATDFAEMFSEIVYGLKPGDIRKDRTDRRTDKEEAEYQAKLAAEATRIHNEGVDERNKKRDEDAKAHQATQERIVHIDEQTAKKNEENRRKALTDEQRMNELLERRAKIKTELNNLGLSEEQRAKLLKEKADTEGEILDINKRVSKPLKAEQPTDALSRVGLYIGGRRDPLVGINEQQLQQMKVMTDLLDEISKQKPPDIFGG